MSEEVVYKISEKMYETLIEWQQENEERGFEPQSETTMEHYSNNNKSLPKEDSAEVRSSQF